MDLVDLISRQGVTVGAAPKDQPEALALLARQASTLLRIPAEDIERALADRERLGSSAIGRGVALPHAQLPGVARPVCVFHRLTRPIAFDAVDRRPVDLLCALLMPVETGTGALKALAAVTRVLRDDQMAARLRKAPDAHTLFILLAHRVAHGPSTSSAPP